MELKHIETTIGKRAWRASQQQTGGKKMALGILAWDLPPAERMEEYEAAAKTWIAAVLQQPGVKEFRAYRNPFGTSPQVVTHTEFDSLASWLAFLQTDAYANIVADIRAKGCTNLTSEVWDVSVVAPEPLKPPSG